MNIDMWLDEFKKSWSSKNVGKVMSLFDENVDYWESPTEKFESFKDIESEWRNIEKQEDIRIETKLESTINEVNFVNWKLQYRNNEMLQNWAGIYRIKLNEQGKCNYFYQDSKKVLISE